VKTYCWVIYPRYLSPLRHLPGPKDGSLIFGQILNQFTSPDPNDMVLSWMERWPHADLIRYLMFGGTEFLVVNSIKAMHEIAQTHCYAFIKPPFLFRTSGSIIGRGIFFAEGDEHKRQKRSLAGKIPSPFPTDMLPLKIIQQYRRTVLELQHQETSTYLRHESAAFMLENPAEAQIKSVRTGRR
jgi:hypothetical protein